MNMVTAPTPMKTQAPTLSELEEVSGDGKMGVQFGPAVSPSLSTPSGVRPEGLALVPLESECWGQPPPDAVLGYGETGVRLLRSPQQGAAIQWGGAWGQ